MMRMMVDIETLSTETNAVVLSIGAVIFGETKIIEDPFYSTPDYLHQLASGRIVDKDCLAWWKKQGELAQDVVSGNLLTRESNFNVALELNRVYQSYNCKEIWCQGDFDIPIIRSWMETYSTNPAWHFGAVRDSRTLRKVCRLKEPEFDGVKHNALADAIYQTERVLDCFRSMK